MGTFIIRPTSLISGGTPLYDYISIPGGALGGWAIDLTDLPSNTIIKALNIPGTIANPPINIVQAICNSAAVANSFVNTLRLGFGGASIYLDGSGTPISASALVPGFTPTTAEVRIDNCFPSDPIAIQPAAGTTQYYLQLNTGNNGTLNNSSYAYTPIPSMSKILSNGIGMLVNISVTDASDNGTVFFNNMRIEGTYITITPLSPYSSLLQTPSGPINGGSNIIIGSSGGTVGKPTYTSGTPGPYPGSAPIVGAPFVPLNLLYFNQVWITYLDQFSVLQTIIILSSSYLTWTFNQIIFTMPPIPSPANPPIINIILVGNGTNFTGQVPLGSLQTIYFLDGSGIYTLSPTATSDTLYVNGTSQIIATPIPNPYIKTGFIP